MTNDNEEINNFFERLNECANAFNPKRRSEITGVLNMLNTILKSKQLSQQHNDLIDRMYPSLKTLSQIGDEK